jgi:hypothetical protein
MACKAHLSAARLFAGCRRSWIQGRGISVRISFACVIVLICAGRSAFASQGQLGVEAVVGNELGILHRPSAGYEHASGTLTYIPRLGANIVYGLRNHVDVSLGCEVSLQRDVVARNVSYQKVSEGDLYANYTDILLPLKVTYRSGVGAGVSFIGSLSGGVIFGRWEDRYMLPSDSIDTPVVPLYIKASTDWHTDAFGRAAIGAEWRPAHWIALTASPYAAYGTNKNLGFGMLLGADFLFAFGGFWDPA